jgi:hypothetical protein
MFGHCLSRIFCKNNPERKMIMHTILMNLYKGNLNLSERKPTDFPLRKYHSRECDKLRKRLEGTLNEEEQKLLDDLLEEQTSDNTYTDMESFIVGFRLATMLMVEVFHDIDNLFENKEQHLRHMLHRPFVDTPSAMNDFSDNE